MRNIEDFISSLPKDEQIILKMLRNLIIDADPRVQEKLSYGVPYYSRNRRMFFLWPASALSSARNKKKAPPKVTMGFSYGNLLSNEQQILNRENRKQVFTIPFSSVSEIDERILLELVNEAIIIDDNFLKNR